MMGFLHPDSGTITIDGFSSNDPNYHKFANSVGYLINANNLVDNWTGTDHIKYLEALRGVGIDVGNLTKRLSFNPKTKVKNLSTGNKQKLSLILALMHKPKLLILDEPTTGLDPLLQDEFFKIVKEFKQGDGTVFISSHNLGEVERLCSRVAIIKEGKLLNVESISEIGQKKLQTIEINFENHVSFDDIKVSNMSVVSEIENGYILRLSGEIDKFIKKISTHKVKSLHIAPASLEEIFLQYYKG
jgi:ABC-2 type transport system ATP-binding protein